VLSTRIRAAATKRQMLAARGHLVIRVDGDFSDARLSISFFEVSPLDQT
jgi:hypothetical protein